ncbi:hypothetical protein C2G38_2167122 [Gigaspora rosea]|uniref:Uncharacterized protein n=1 Tax=Gigaspora rosea TaxID=44941 RepID=A0A397VVG5_9GLOM|nr:hypothetical protein C2G38_2167122 [Gigaspora rosea]
MLIHASVVVFITTKNENNSFTHGIAQYQPSENVFSTIHWKRFDSSDKSNNNFLIGDIVSIAGKFVIENSEQFITIASATIVDKKDSTDEFNSEIITFNTIHLMFNATVTHDLKTSGETIHFGVETREYNSYTGNHDIHISITVYYPIQRTNKISATTSSIHNNRTKQNDNNNEQEQKIKSEHNLEKEKIEENKKGNGKRKSYQYQNNDRNNIKQTLNVNCYIDEEN